MHILRYLKSNIRRVRIVAASPAVAVMAFTAGAATDSLLQKADIGRIDRHYFHSAQLADTIAVDVWTPPGYADGNDRHPIIYMHDGQNLFDASTTWNHQSWNVDSIAGSLIADGVIEAPIVVGIHSDPSSRIATLMPSKGVAAIDMGSGEFAQLLQGHPLQGDEYVDFMTSTLKPAIDSLYRTRPERASTFVAGSSMGGLMSIYALCERPDIFGNAICLSTHWSGTPEVSREFADGLLKYIDSRIPSVAEAAAMGYVPRLYFDHGTTTIDASYGEYEDLVVAMLREKGYGPAHLMTYVAEGAPHEERAWQARFHLPLIFMLHR